MDLPSYVAVFYLVWIGKRLRINLLLNYFDYKMCYKRATWHQALICQICHEFNNVSILCFSNFFRNACWETAL